MRCIEFFGMKKLVFSIFLMSFVLFSADIKIPVQGFLADSEGVAINGNQNISFSLYNIDSGGDSIWSNQEAISIEVKDGMFSQMLGEVDFINSELIENAAPLYLEVKVNDEVLLPRIELGIESKSAYSYNSAKLEGRTLSEVKAETLGNILARLEALETSKVALETKVTALEEANTQKDAKILALETEVNSLNLFSGDYNDLINKPVTITSAQSDEINNNSNKVSSLSLNIDTLLGYINGNGTDIFNLKTKTASMSINGDNVVFTGVNLQVVNGTGYTCGSADCDNSFVVNGKGNLIIGYDEARYTDSNKSGSHNLVIGPEHNYSSYGGMVVGYRNEISGKYSSVSGGGDNTASGRSSSVSGGRYNTASEESSSVSGGYDNKASGRLSSVSGGDQNKAQSKFSTVSGGYNHVTPIDDESYWMGGTYSSGH